MRSCDIVSVLPSTLAEVAGCGLRLRRPLCGLRTQPIAPLLHPMRMNMQRSFARRRNGSKVSTRRSSSSTAPVFSWIVRSPSPGHADRQGPLIPDPAKAALRGPASPDRSGRAGLCVGQPYNGLKKAALRARKCLFRRTLIRSARFLLQTLTALLPAICGQVPCSAGNVEVRHERKQRREASAKARTPVHFISRSVFHAGHDPGRHGDFRAPAAAGRPHVPQGLVNTARRRCGASRRISAKLFACEG